MNKHNTFVTERMNVIMDEKKRNESAQELDDEMMDDVAGGFFKPAKPQVERPLARPKALRKEEEGFNPSSSDLFKQ